MIYSSCSDSMHGTNGNIAWNVDVYGKLVGKYASPMDAMGSGCLRVPEVQQRVKALKEWWDWDMNSGIHNQPLIGS